MRSLGLLLLSLSLFAVRAAAQINPGTQISWPTCTSLQYYSPFDNACHSVSGGFTAGGDLSGSSISQNVIGIQGHALPSLASGYPHWTGSAWVYDTPSGGAAAVPICSDTSGSGTAQSCTTSPSFTPGTGSCVAYTTTTANTGSGLTLNVNSSAADSVAKWQGTTTLAAGDVPANKMELACLDSGSKWELSTIGNAPSGGTTFNPLDVNQLAASGEVVSTYQEQLFIPSNSTSAVADIKGTSGTIVGYTIGFCPGTTACSGAGNVNSNTLNFYYDGNIGTPDMSFNYGDAGSSWQASNTTFQSQRISSIVANGGTGQGGFYFSYPMYFSSEWKMTVTVPSSLTSGATAWITVWYTTATTSALRMHAKNVQGASVNLASSSYNMLNLSGSGIIAGFVLSVQAGSQTSFNYMEANVQTYLDGSTAIGQAVPMGGSSGVGCSAGDILGVTQSGASGGEVMVLDVNSGAVTALTPVIGHLGSGYTTASSLSTTAVSSTCTTTPTIYVSTAANGNDSMEGYTFQSLEFGTTITRQSNWGFVSAYAPTSNTHGLTVFWDTLDQQKGNRFNSGVQVIWQADPIKAAAISSGAVTFDYLIWYYQ